MNRLNVLKKYSMNLKNYTDKFQFVELTLKLAKTAYKSVGGLYSCSDIFDFELSFLG